ncbi:MAG: hypothetical protein HZA02_05215, partial [Nitrospinae bacterium]|nr:hypothetical protein [Nitrospinota bacterium]
TLEQDIHQIKEDVAALRKEIAVLHEDQAVLKAEMKHFATKEDVERMGRTLIMWNVSSMIALAGIVVAVVKLIG